MNKTTHDIAALLEVDLETAWKVQQQMMEEAFDFSECTTEELNEEAEITAMWMGVLK